MDVEVLARLQFALTIMFHYIYPPLSIGLGLMLVIIEGKYLWTKDLLYKEMAKFWTKIFALTFAIGVATGIVMEFEFGTNWATYSRFVGDVFGSALAAEGIFAFFLESGFLALLLFGWDRIRPGWHYFATCMVALGAHFSAIWIVVANSWMQTPAGYRLVGEGLWRRAEIYDFWAMVFNPSSMTRLAHTVVGAWLAGSFLVISVAAYYLIKRRHLEFARSSLNLGLAVSFIALILQLVTGDRSDKIVAQYQPAKLAAFEGLFKTQTAAPLYLFGLPNLETQRVDYGLALPGALSFLISYDFKGEVAGLDQIARQDWPNTRAVFQTYHLMIYMWAIMLILSLWAFYAIRKRQLETSPWLLRALTFAVLCPQIANQAGWVSAEMGRYPWIVYDLMRISEGLSKAVQAEQVLGSLILFTILYIALFALFLYSLDHKIRFGPTDVDREHVYHALRQVVTETSHGTRTH